MKTDHSFGDEKFDKIMAIYHAIAPSGIMSSDDVKDLFGFAENLYEKHLEKK